MRSEGIPQLDDVMEWADIFTEQRNTIVATMKQHLSGLLSEKQVCIIKSKKLKAGVLKQEEVLSREIAKLCIIVS